MQDPIMDLMSMKSSRRKQSKPIRVSYNDDSDMPLPPNRPVDEMMNRENYGSNDMEQEKENKYDESSDSYMDSRSDQDVASPINLAMRDSQVAFPTAYHRLASEFSMKGAFVPNGHNNSAMDSENNIDRNGNDVIDGDYGEKGDGEKPKDRSGIFHPDAYCELCDKEFCNKYFLKTHKANKHGIYENSTSPFAPSVNPLPPSMVLPQDYSNLPFKLNMDYQLPPMKPASNPPKPPTPQLTPNSSVPAASPRQSPPLSQGLSQTPVKPSPAPSPLLTPSKPKSDTSSTTGSENGDKKIGGQDMEDFCEICQKHFCNKYYLKKHKNDVHGIAPPDTPMSGKRGGRPPNSEIKLPATPSSADSPLIPHSLANLPGLPNMPGVMVLNPFLPPMLLPGGLHGPMQPRPPHLQMTSPLPYSGAASMPQSCYSDVKSFSPGLFTTAATSISPTAGISTEALRNLGIPIPEGASPNEALRRMGLMSPDGQITSDILRGMGIIGEEAFCDICRKEFCNKYFLKIHKANKHGIYTDEPLLPPGMVGAMNMTLPTKSSDSTANTSESGRSSDKERECDRERDRERERNREREHDRERDRDRERERDRERDRELAKDNCNGNKPESSPKAATTPVSQPSEFLTNCNLCSQEFASKYAYRIHRIQAHGMINEPFNEAELAEEAFRLHNGELPKHVSNKIAEEISAMERNSEAAGFSTMFGSMVAAKLADRVTCDICNKELCNKYFLKVHKMKVHGIDIQAQERSPKAGTTMQQSERSYPKLDFSPSAGSRMDFNNFARTFNLKPDQPKEMGMSRPNSSTSMDNANQHVERPSNEELVKMGMDPEAYCEICKKEFCSKYFLRTHKQNIHGIPPKTESQEKMHTMQTMHSVQSMVMGGGSMAPHLALSTPLLPTSFMSNMSPFGQNKPMNLSSASFLGNGFGVRTPKSNPGKPKEPQNSARVTCELCNKELCNKYFLRTHKINKHGILPEDLSPCASLNMSPNTSDIETSSNSSFPMDFHDKSMQSPKLNLENSKLFTNRMDDSQNQYSEALNLKMKSEYERFSNNNEAETCHLCNRKFKSSKWLKQHILKDHAGLTALSPTMEKAFNLGGRYAPLELRTCSVCSIVFPSEMSMQLHMIQEHNAQVTIKTEGSGPASNDFESRGLFSGTVKKYGLKPRFSFSLKQKSYNCSVCNHSSKWLSNILSHERCVHGIDHNTKKFQCKSCRKVFRKSRVLRLHMMKVHGDYSMTERSQKQYRCTTCDKSFPTPLQCHLHIRKDHIRAHSFRVNNHRSDVRHHCSKCSFSTRFPKQLQRHVLRCTASEKAANKASLLFDTEHKHFSTGDLRAEALNTCDDYTMQTFQIQQCNDDGVFVSAIVKMPVLKKLEDSTSVSFLVTPVDAQ